MSKNKTTRKKLIISISALCVGFLSIFVAVFAVYAAHTQNSQAGFNVQYDVGKNVGVTVGASYQIENSSKVEIGSLSFNVDTVNGQGNLPVSEKIILTTPTEEDPISHKYVEFTYTFENLLDTASIKVMATWQTFQNDVQFLDTYIDGVKFTDFATTSIASGIIIEPLQTKTVVIKFDVQSNGANARMKSDSSTGLKWILSHNVETT